MKKKTTFLSKKGDIWISVVLFILIATIVVVIVLEGLTPLLENMKDKSVFVRTQDTFLNLNQHIKDVSLEGQGSQRVVPVDIQKGIFEVKNNVVRWEMDTDATLLQPRTSVPLGNVMIVSDGDVQAYETATTFVLENSVAYFAFNKTGGSTNYTGLNTSSLLVRSALKTNAILTDVTPGFSFYIDGDSSTALGNGYTSLLNKGTGLGKATVLAHVNASAKEYELLFTLESQADYLLTDVRAATVGASG